MSSVDSRGYSNFQTKKSRIHRLFREIYQTTNKSTIQKNYVNIIYEETLKPIREFIRDGPIWVSIDESTDAEGRYIGNVIIGKLCSEPTKSFLLNCVQLEKCNNKTFAKLFNDSMNLLWCKI